MAFLPISHIYFNYFSGPSNIEMKKWNKFLPGGFGETFSLKHLFLGCFSRVLSDNWSLLATKPYSIT